MAPLFFTFPAPLPISAASRTCPNRHRHVSRRYRILPRTATMKADVPASDESQIPKSFNNSDREALLMDPEDQEFAKWAASAERDELEEGNTLDLDGYLEIDPELEEGELENGLEDGVEDVVEDDEIVFDDDDDDEDDDDDDDDDDEDEEDEDEELEARAENDDFEDDVSVERVQEGGERGGNTRVAALAGVDEDVNDEIQDEEELVEPIVDDISPIFKQAAGIRDREVPLSDDEDADIPPGADVDDDGLFGAETDEDIQNAAKILSKSGILGLDSNKSKRYAIDAPETTGNDVPIPIEGDDFVDDLPLDDDEDAFDDKKKEEDGLNGYVDMDAYDDDEEFALTSKSSLGRVWELNDDIYVTITEPGEAYVYELDEDDQEDQEMFSMRRGKEGGWSGGLASYYESSLPKGSKEWVARRAYELVAQCNQKEMFLWTRRRKGPPPIIDDLFPPDPAPSPRLPKTKLKQSTPVTSTPAVGEKSSRQAKEREPDLFRRSDHGYAVDKSISFPCRYEFQAEGVGDNLEKELGIELEKVLGRPIPFSAFHVEPAGKHKKVIITLTMESALQVPKVFEALRNCPSVVFSYN